ncbi:MAG: glycosyltransferase [Chloroflexi bacterium]|nr:glycosyltransferase [Chloroflexota bacterium]
MRVAIVCSWLNQYGGAERVLEAIKSLYPDAPIYTSIFWPDALPESYRSWEIHVSALDHFPFIHRYHRLFLPLYPLAFEAFDLSAYDLILSVTSAFAHGVVTTPQSLHICYCLTPARFLWDYENYVQREGIARALKLLLPFVLRGLRQWDRLAADRVDEFVAISEEVARRIAKYYRRPSQVIYPPVETARFKPSEERGDYFLIISRLVPYKRIDLAVEAFNRLGLPLVVIGDGRDRAALERIAQPNIRFLGRVSDRETSEYLARCRAFIFPGEEDFGIAPLEAQAAGRPVIAYAGGGALETVQSGVTGTFFYPQTADALAEAVASFDETRYNPIEIRRNAENFDVSVFQQRFREFVESRYAARCVSPIARGGYTSGT